MVENKVSNGINSRATSREIIGYDRDGNEVRILEVSSDKRVGIVLGLYPDAVPPTIVRCCEFCGGLLCDTNNPFHALLGEPWVYRENTEGQDVRLDFPSYLVDKIVSG